MGIQSGKNLSARTKRDNLIEFQSKQFAQGAVRMCFRGKIIAGPDKGDQAVVKVFKDEKLRSQFTNATLELKVYSLANDYARMFCEKLQQHKITKIISFPQPDLVEIKDLSLWTIWTSSNFKIGEYICVEKFLPGAPKAYKKFTSNIGHSTKDQIMECFQHYTFLKSGGQAIVCDLQGVYVSSAEKYILTDPAVNSQDRRFGCTDIGPTGIIEILSRHLCNDVCKKIGLADNKSYDKIKPPVYNSTTKRRSFVSGI